MKSSYAGRRNKIRLAIILLAFAPVFSRAAFAASGEVLPFDSEKCLECHGDDISAKKFESSAHASIGCTSCHLIADLQKHMDGDAMPKTMACERCHENPAAEYYASVHAKEGVTCTDCHSDIHGLQPWKGKKELVVQHCLDCHQEQRSYVESVHGRGVMRGNEDSAACNDCHGLHRIRRLGPSNSIEYREFHTAVCLRCHSNAKMMSRNGVSTMAVKTYMESPHGRNYRLGYPRLVAGCADCHTAHDILLPNNPKSTVNPDNLVRTCSQCHRHVTPLFTRFWPHADLANPARYPVLYWTFVGMTVLILVVFGAFWPHSVLWLFRGFIANREKKAEMVMGRHLPPPDAYTVYRRFRPLHILLHVMAIVSFLGLSLTGLPLRFDNHTWARWLMGIYGGPMTAVLIHKICAGILFLGFLIVLFMILRFLFRKDVSGSWMERLFGPDSLMPNFRDVKDIGHMVRWFLFRGPQPTFERWTYWEKFDFFAVFWGMFAIGGSGLILLFPQFITMVLPGWVINVAIVIHSEEALLATGFIFSVHFFNTHGRPNKFPMDSAILNGEITKEEFLEERGDQWRRCQEEGKAEQLKMSKVSGALYDFLLKGLGFTALLIGIVLMGAMISSFFFR